MAFIDLKEHTKVMLPLGVIFALILSALAFVRNGDLTRLAQDEIIIHDSQAKIEKIEVDQATLRIEQENEIKVLEEVRLDVKLLLEQNRVKGQ